MSFSLAPVIISPSRLQNIILIIIKKLEYSSDYDFNDECEDEAMFQDYRKNIKLIFNAVAKMVGFTRGILELSALYIYYAREYNFD